MKIQIINNGSTVSFHALDADATERLHSIGAEGWQFLGRSTLVVDWRCAEPLMQALIDDGVEFEGN